MQVNFNFVVYFKLYNYMCWQRCSVWVWPLKGWNI